MLLDENSMNICFNIINDVIEKLIKDVEQNPKKGKNINFNNPNNKSKDKDEFIPYFLYEILSEVYDNIIKENLKNFSMQHL